MVDLSRNTSKDNVCSTLRLCAYRVASALKILGATTWAYHPRQAMEERDYGLGCFQL